VLVAVVFVVVLNQRPNTTGPGTFLPTATPISTPTSPSLVTFAVTSVDLVVNPYDITGKACGSSVSFTYTTTFHIPADTAGGTIQFMYTTDNGRGSTNASVNVSAGAITATYIFTKSGSLSADHTFPGVAEVMVTSPGNAQSPPTIVSGTCKAAA